MMSMSKIAARTLITALIVLSFTLAPPFPVAEVEAPQEQIMEGDITLTVHPDMSFEVEIVGESIWTRQPWETYSLFSGISLHSMNGETGDGLRKIEGTLLATLGPDVPEELSDLDLEASSHWEGKRSESTVIVNLPGVIGVDGSVVYEFLEDSQESALNLDLTVTVWYSAYPKEDVEEFVQMFPMLRAELMYQLSESTDGRVRVEELDLVSSELGQLSANLAVTARIVGEFDQAILDPSGAFFLSYMGFLQAAPAYGSQLMDYSGFRSGDLRISFDKEETTFSAEFEVVLEGDLDEQFNALKDAFFERVLEEGSGDEEEEEIVTEFLLPTEFSVVDLETNFDYRLESDSHELRFSIEGLAMEPPSPQVVLKLLGDASDDVEQPGFTLTIEGASDEDEYVETVVPDATSEPISMEGTRVAWAFDDIENLEMVTFEVKESERAGQSISTPVMISIGGVAVAAVAAASLILRKK